MNEKPVSPMEPPEFVDLAPKVRKKAQKYSALRDIMSVVFVLLAAGALSIALIAFVFQSYQVDGPSMESTLQNNDRLIVWKVPRTWAMITGHQYVPDRGDIIIFSQNNLAQFGQADVKQLVKRVIGLPGDRVVIQNGSITIYNKAHPDGFNPDKTLPYGQNHTFPYTAGDLDITLKSNQIFVCGDNRTDSLDSRSFGPVGVNSVVGRLVLRVFPFDTFKSF